MGNTYEAWHTQIMVAAASLPGAGTPYAGPDPTAPPEVTGESQTDMALRYALTMIRGLIDAGNRLAREVDRLNDEIEAMRPSGDRLGASG
jgi:hypothetical protein